MKNLVLTNEETKTLKYWGVVEITRNGFNMLVEYDEIDEDYRITIINPYKKVCLAKEPKRNAKKVLAAVFDPKKMHPYDVKTTGKHPVHMIEGGEYLTESEEIFEVLVQFSISSHMNMTERRGTVELLLEYN